LAAPYIPPKNAAFVAWAANFSSLLTASPTTYGSDAPTAVTVAALNATLQAAYTVITTPSDKSKTTVLAFNNAKQAFLATVRPLAVLISRNPGVASSDKTAIGVNLPNNTPSPIPTPTTSPIISFVGSTPGQSTYTFADQNTPAKRIKPQGVIQLQVFATIAATVGTDPTAALLVASPTKSPFALNFTSGQAGMICTVWGKWTTRSSGSGPWSAAIHQIVPST
jgi:hypothetical protein